MCSSFDESLADKVYKQPTEFLPLFEESATEVADEVTSPRPEGEEEVEPIQVVLQSESNPSSVRNLSSDQVCIIFRASETIWVQPIFSLHRMHKN